MNTPVSRVNSGVFMDSSAWALPERTFILRTKRNGAGLSCATTNTTSEDQERENCAVCRKLSQTISTFTPVNQPPRSWGLILSRSRSAAGHTAGHAVGHTSGHTAWHAAWHASRHAAGHAAGSSSCSCVHLLHD